MIGIIILVITALIAAIILFADKKKLKRLFIVEAPEKKETPEAKEVPETSKSPAPSEPTVSQPVDDIKTKQNKVALREIERKMERLATRKDIEGLKRLSKERNSLLKEMGVADATIQNDELDEYARDLLEKNN